MAIVLTERDVRLLQDLYDNSCLSFDQIKQFHFSGLAKPTVINRLSRLKADRLVTSHSIGTVIHHYQSRRVGVVYQITRRGIQVLSERISEREHRALPVRLNTTTLVHDLILADVIRRLRELFRESTILNAKLAHPTDTAGARVPDAMMHLDEDSCCAVELELTPKSDRRYREIVTQYRLSRVFDSVLYVTASPTITRKIQRQITGGGATISNLKLSTGKFYFVDLGSLLSPGDRPSINNGTEDFVCR